MSDYFPDEIITKILARLPIDSLLRCTIISKSWYSLITSPSFISSHLNLSISNQEPRLLIRYTTDHYCLHRDNQTLDKIAKLDFPFTNIIATFNGLFCVSDYRMETIMLWNPSLRKSLILPKPRVLFASHGFYRKSMGFGFLPTTNNYKVVRVTYLDLFSGLKLPPAVEIFELSTGSWHNVNAHDFSYVIEDYAPQAFLNGVVYWIAYNLNKVGRTFDRLVASFDMSSEKLGALMVPNCLQIEQCERCFGVSTIRESLCLVHCPDTLCSIWIMKEYGVAESWEKQYNIDLKQYGLQLPLYLRENGDILSVNDDPAFVSYDPINNKVMNVGLTEKVGSVVVDNYVESLVLIKANTF